MSDATRLTSEQARAKAAECRAMAQYDRNEAHRIMLLHIAETWERIAAAATVTNGGAG